MTRVNHSSSILSPIVKEFIAKVSKIFEEYLIKGLSNRIEEDDGMRLRHALLRYGLAIRDVGMIGLQQEEGFFEGPSREIDEAQEKDATSESADTPVVVVSKVTPEGKDPPTSQV
ncbi:hypothetical protein ACOSP7_019381 [Xanthoceras sorbifolium]